MAACTFPWENVPDPFVAEARACLQAVTMAEEMGFGDICVEGDALSIIRKLNSEEEDRSNVSGLIQDIYERRSRFRSLRLQYVPRKANSAAHEMAKEWCQYVTPRYWIEEVPQVVEGIVNRERRLDLDEG
ncbi:hypothetical protein J1N35_020051 [Gossypium stocksii]|uniref:RNase H type-1 domain-containing protein n=1 Tax=Gossypium stocksii TaxID=47602 RepID=A0A9D4A0N0_9ROSI|nr:hypothetical protein J1N35_020051 [Gossypium stocksii]